MKDEYNELKEEYQFQLTKYKLLELKYNELNKQLAICEYDKKGLQAILNTEDPRMDRSIERLEYMIKLLENKVTDTHISS